MEKKVIFPNEWKKINNEWKKKLCQYQGRRRFFSKKTGTGNRKNAGNGKTGNFSNWFNFTKKNYSSTIATFFLMVHLWFKIKTFVNELIINTRNQSMANFRE
jgi:hypothetical protein